MNGISTPSVAARQLPLPGAANEEIDRIVSCAAGYETAPGFDVQEELHRECRERYPKDYYLMEDLTGWDAIDMFELIKELNKDPDWRCAR